jgi:hypothetical protein
MAGLTYKVIGGTWQAEGAVRSELDKRPASLAEETSAAPREPEAAAQITSARHSFDAASTR